jgi:hypothetical protein
VNRRAFALGLAGAWAASTFDAVAASARQEEDEVSPRARALYRRALILDGNSAPPGGDLLPLPQADL